MKKTIDTENRGFNYDEAIDELQPRCEFRASAGLRDRIMQTAREESAAERHEPHFVRRTAVWLSAAAVIVAALFAVNPLRICRAYAASRMFATAAEKFGSTPAFSMDIYVRTDPHDSFSYIDASADFVTHRLTVEPYANRWRLEKLQRVAVNDGRNIWLWITTADAGMKFPSTELGVLEDFAMLLDPQALLSREESQALANRRAKYVKRVDGDAVVLTVEVPAEGEFVHGVGRNTSVSESDTRREYRFDRGSGRLTGVKIDMLDGGAATTVVELKNIAYDIEVDASLFTHPEDGIAWTDLTKPVGSDLFAGITPELAVDKMFAAMRTWDSAVLEQIITFVPVDRFEKYKGCMLVESGDHFRSGDYAGVFVPCKVKFADGSTEKLLVALRNDNAKGAWVLDGGM